MGRIISLDKQLGSYKKSISWWHELDIPTRILLICAVVSALCGAIGLLK